MIVIVIVIIIILLIQPFTYNTIRPINELVGDKIIIFKIGIYTRSKRPKVNLKTFSVFDILSNNFTWPRYA